MRTLVFFVLFGSTLALAKDKPQYSYQDGVLLSFRMQPTGSECTNNDETSGTVNANTDSNGDTSGRVSTNTTGTASCRDTERALYTIKSGGSTYLLTPDHSTGANLGMALFPLAGVFTRNSSLAYQLPGTQIKLRSDGKHFFVKVGKRESMYSIVEFR